MILNESYCEISSIILPTSNPYVLFAQQKKELQCKAHISDLPFPHFLWIPLSSPSLLALSIWHYPSTLVLIELSSCISLTGAALSVTGILIWRSIWVPLISEPPVELSCSLVYLNEILLLLEDMRRIIMFQGPQGPCCLRLAMNISSRIN